MKIVVKRIFKGPEYTIGHLYIDDKYICDTIEDKCRGLDDSMSLDAIKSIKVMHKTAIPTGTYKVTLNVVSPKFSKYPFYQKVCKGKVPRLLNVKGFDGILIHVANGPRGADLVSGCLGVGLNKIKGGLLESRECFEKLYSILLQDPNDITITIE